MTGVMWFRLLPCLGLLAGCGASTVWPQFVAEDTASGFPEPTSFPCGEDGPPADLLIQLETWYPAVVAIYEILPATCTETQVATLAPGQAWQGTPPTGHTWVARELDGRYVSHFTVPPGSGAVTEFIP
jgi:hypothetical protein